MGCWIPGPEQLCWPANQNRRPRPESPHQAAIADAKDANDQPKRTRRTKKVDSEAT